MFWPMWGDWTFILVIPAIIFVFWAQHRVKSTFHEYSRYATRSGVTAAQVARDILDRNGLHDVRIEYVPGHLTDHYDPREKVVRLSSATYHSTSIAAIGVAAHEVGHAIQHEVAYVPLNMRNLLFPLARIGDMFGPFLAMIGLFIAWQSGNLWLMNLGIMLFAFAVGFYIITLPVEFNASSRAVAILETGGYMTRDEVEGARKVLGAAALTYVAAAAVSIANLLRLLLLRSMASRDE